MELPSVTASKTTFYDYIQRLAYNDWTKGTEKQFEINNNSARIFVSLKWASDIFYMRL